MSQAERDKWNAAFRAKTDNPRASGAASPFIAERISTRRSEEMPISASIFIERSSMSAG